MALTNAEIQKRYRERMEKVIRFYEKITGIKRKNVIALINKPELMDKLKNKSKIKNNE